MTEFTPWMSLAGGVLIGQSALLLMAGLGRVAGIAGILAGHWDPTLMFVMGGAIRHWMGYRRFLPWRLGARAGARR